MVETFPPNQNRRNQFSIIPFHAWFGSHQGYHKHTILVQVRSLSEMGKSRKVTYELRTTSARSQSSYIQEKEEFLR